MSILLLFILIVFEPEIHAFGKVNGPMQSQDVEEYTDSYIPAGMQVLSHYITQLEDLQNKRSEGENEEGRAASNGNSDQGGKESWYEKTKGSSSESDKIAKKTKSQLRTLVTALNREAKRQDLGRYQGFSSNVLTQLEETSKMSPNGQLTYVLDQINKGEIKRTDVRTQVSGLLKDLEDKDSELNKDLEFVTPLHYLS